MSPVPAQGNGREFEESGLIAVLFTEQKEGDIDGVTEKYDVDTTAARRIANLEQELHESPNDLKATIGELETVNEELQSVNEELYFAHSFPEENIIQDANAVLRDLVPIDREVTAMNGRHYTLRIAPYRTTENSIRVLVITIIDSLGAKSDRSHVVL